MKLFNNLIGKSGSNLDKQMSLIENVLYQSDIGYHQLDKDRKILLVNKAWLETLGYEENEVVGRPFEDFLTDDFKVKFKKCFNNLPKTSIMENVTMGLMHKDGYYVKVTFNTTVTTDENDEVIKNHALFKLDTASSAVDMPLLGYDPDTLAEKISTQSKLETISDVLNAVAHRWNKPLECINSRMEEINTMLEGEMLDKEAVADNVLQTQRNVSELTAIIEEFKSFFNSKDTATSFNIIDLVFDTLEVYSSKFEYAGIDFEVICDCSKNHFKLKNELKRKPCENDKYEMDCNRTEFKQIIIKLLSNAIYAVQESIKKGSVTRGHIGFLIKFSDNSAALSITNNGESIPKDIITRVFEPYFSTKEGYSGIGLFIVKSVVEKSMKGTVSIENTHDGVVTSVSVPIRYI